MNVFRKIRLTFLLAVLFNLIISQHSYGQNIIQINPATQPIREVLKQIEQQSGLTFVYSSRFASLNQSITLNKNSGSVSELLAQISAKQPLKFIAEGRQIIVRQQEMGTVQGSVKTSDGQPAGYVTVNIQGQRSIQTDMQGQFILEHIETGSHIITASYIGLQTQRQKVEVQTNTLATVDFILSEDAQTLQEVVVNGEHNNKFAQKETEAVARMPLKNLENPQVYTVLPENLIKEQVTTDVGEAMRNIPGALAIKAGGGSSGIMSRGFATYANIRNGMNTSAIGPEDPINLERIEAIKGPSGTLFGNISTSYGGLVNYVTKKPTDGFKGEVSYTTGSWELSRLAADINTPLNATGKLLFRATGSLQSQNSFQDQGYAKSFSFSPKLAYQVNDRLNLSIEAEMLGQDWSSAASSSATIGTNVTAKSFKGLGLTYNRALTGNAVSNQNGIVNVFAQADYKLSDQWISKTTYTYSEGHYDHYNYITFNWIDNNTVARQIGYWEPNKFGQIEFQQNFIGDFHIGHLRNRLVAGFDYSRYYYLLNRSTSSVYDTVHVDANIPEISKSGLDAWAGKLNYTYSSYVRNVYSVYASDVLNLMDNFMIMLSLRVDRNETDGSYNGSTGLHTGAYKQTAFSPKLGIVYQPVKDVLSIFANYMNGFQNLAPAAQGPDGSITALKPQKANQWEGGIKAELIRGKLSGTLSYYNINVSNATYADPNNAAYTIQDGTQKSKGFEAEIILNPISGLNIMAGYGNNENKFVKSSQSLQGKYATAAPKNIANLWISYQLTRGKVNGLGFGAGGNYVGDSWFNATNTFMLPAYTLLNASVFYNRPRYSLNLKMNNLLDEHFWNSGGYAQNTRNVAASLTYKF